jgi:hypothetical protein
MVRQTPPIEKKKVTASYSIRFEQIQQIQNRAEEEGITPSKLIQNILDNHYELKWKQKSPKHTRSIRTFMRNLFNTVKDFIFGVGREN